MDITQALFEIERAYGIISKPRASLTAQTTLEDLWRSAVEQGYQAGAQAGYAQGVRDATGQEE